jgi:hypothetical protein
MYVYFILRKSRVYVVNGIRRSGNHALISWLVDALEGQNGVNMELKDGIWTSESGETIHINEANMLSLLQFIVILRENKELIKSAKNVFITLEDYIPKTIDIFIPRNATKINVSRSLLNICASRFKHNVDRSREGLDRGDMSINKKLLTCVRWHHSPSAEDWITWIYEKWLKESEYRKSFLEALCLSYDSKIPPSSNFGGGSSFSNSELGKSDNNPLKRWEQVKFPDRVIFLLYSDGLDLLESDEYQYVVSEYQKRKDAAPV